MARAEKLRVLPLVLGLSPLLALTPVAAHRPSFPVNTQQATSQETPARRVPQVQVAIPLPELENVDLKVTTGPSIFLRAVSCR